MQDATRLQRLVPLYLCLAVTSFPSSAAALEQEEDVKLAKLYSQMSFFDEAASLIQIDVAFQRRQEHLKVSNSSAARDSESWPSARGACGRYSWSPYPGPNVTTPSWIWHSPKGKWATVGVGTSIDKQKNIYLTAMDGIRKFSPDGQMLWQYSLQSYQTELLDTEDLKSNDYCKLNFGEWHNRKNCGKITHATNSTGVRRVDPVYTSTIKTVMQTQYEILSKAAVLMGDAVYGITTAGRAFSLSQDKGHELWSTNVSSNGSDMNFGQVNAHDGVVVTAVDQSDETDRKTPILGPANHKVVGLDSTDGKVLWEYVPDVPVWNFGSAFVGDGSFVYQDLEGTVYQQSARSGSLLRKADTGVSQSWTDGQSNLGANQIVYSTANFGMALPGTQGSLTATNLSTGQVVWTHHFPWSANSIPAVGWLAGQPNNTLSVVMPIGQNDAAGFPLEVHALDADTGEVQWIFKGPKQKYDFGEGDQKRHQQERVKNHVAPMTLPNSWGTPVIDARGAVYVGAITGDFFCLRDINGDGEVSGPDEVSSISTESAFTGSAAPALGPGILAIANANSMIVYEYPDKI